MACNNGTYPNPARNVLPFSLLTGSPGTSGSWIYTSGPGVIPNGGTPISIGSPIPTGNNPTVNFNDACPGSYVLTYTIPAAGTCPASSANVTVNVNDEPCVTISGTTDQVCTICGTVQEIPYLIGTTLSSSCTGGSAPSATYQWQSASSAGGPFTNISGATSSTYTVTSITTSTYYRVIACSTLSPTCCTYDDFFLEVLPNICAGTPTNQNLCGSQTGLNLNSFMSGVVGTGAWTFAPTNVGPTSAVTGIPGPGTGVNITAQSTTTTWIFRNTVTGTGGCTSTADLSITLSLAPNAGVGSSTTICN